MSKDMPGGCREYKGSSMSGLLLWLGTGFSGCKGCLYMLCCAQWSEVLCWRCICCKYRGITCRASACDGVLRQFSVNVSRVCSNQALLRSILRPPTPWSLMSNTLALELHYSSDSSTCLQGPTEPPSQLQPRGQPSPRGLVPMCWYQAQSCWCQPLHPCWHLAPLPYCWLQHPPHSSRAHLHLSPCQAVLLAWVLVQLGALGHLCLPSSLHLSCSPQEPQP